MSLERGGGPPSLPLRRAPSPGGLGAARHRSQTARRRPRIGRWLLVLAILAALAGGAYAWRSQVEAGDARHETAERFAAAWEGRDPAAMWRALSARARATPERRFVTAYRNADREAGVRAVKAGTLGPERDGRIAVPVAVRTDIFGTLRGTIAVPVSGTGATTRASTGTSRCACRACAATRPWCGAPGRSRGAGRCSPPTARGSTGHGARERPAEALRRPARRPSVRAAAVRRAGRRPHARREGPPGADDDRPRAVTRGGGRARRQGRRRRRDPPARRRRAARSRASRCPRRSRPARCSRSSRPPPRSTAPGRDAVDPPIPSRPRRRCRASRCATPAARRAAGR